MTDFIRVIRNADIQEDSYSENVIRHKENRARNNGIACFSLTNAEVSFTCSSVWLC